MIETTVTALCDGPGCFNVLEDKLGKINFISYEEAYSAALAANWEFQRNPGMIENYIGSSYCPDC